MAQAQTDYPNRPLRQIVPFPPGGGVDIVTRIVAAKWGELLGQPIVVENRAGAGERVGADHVARSRTRRLHAVLTCQVASHGVSPALYNKLPYDTIRDFAPVSLIGKTPNVLVVHPSVPARSLKEFIALAKANPGKYNYASPGFGTSPQMTMELFKLTAGINLFHVPYKGGAPALADVMGGQVTGMFGNLPEQLAAIKSGKTRALAVSTLQRSAAAARRPDGGRVRLPRLRSHRLVRGVHAIGGAEADPRHTARDPREDAQHARDEGAAGGQLDRRLADHSGGVRGVHPRRDRKWTAVVRTPTSRCNRRKGVRAIFL